MSGFYWLLFSNPAFFKESPGGWFCHRWRGEQPAVTREEGANAIDGSFTVGTRPRAAARAPPVARSAPCPWAVLLPLQLRGEVLGGEGWMVLEGWVCEGKPRRGQLKPLLPDVAFQEVLDKPGVFCPVMGFLGPFLSLLSTNLCTA